MRGNKAQASGQCVVTLTFGEQYERIARETHPTLRSYAQSVGAQFIVISQRRYPGYAAGYEKLQIANLLEAYDRIIYLDSDLIVRRDTPDLLSEVPYGKFGAVNVFIPGIRADNQRSSVSRFCREAGMPLPDRIPWYFNAGVMVCDRTHRPVFTEPPRFVDAYQDQTWLNLRLMQLGLPLCELPVEYNRTGFYREGDRRNAFIIHYAGNGYAPDVPPGGTLLDLIRMDLAHWKSRGLA